MMAYVRSFTRPWFLLLILWVNVGCSVDRSELFPFHESDLQLPAVDNASAAVQLSIPVALYDQFYDIVHVSCDPCSGSRVTNCLVLLMCAISDTRFRSTMTES